MPKTIATIEREAIVLGDDNIVRYKSKAAIDSDGSGPSHGDRDQEQDTSLHLNGKCLNADIDQYIVVPPAIINGVQPVVLGSQAKVTYDGRSCDAVVGDVGPHRKLGEISIATAKALGIPWSPVNGGVDAHEVYYEIQIGIAADVNGKQYALQPYGG